MYLFFFFQTQKYLGLILLILTWDSVHHLMIVHMAIANLADSLPEAQAL